MVQFLLIQVAKDNPIDIACILMCTCIYLKNYIPEEVIQAFCEFVKDEDILRFCEEVIETLIIKVRSIFKEF